jgi:peptidoglycan L-alanyl-D-glutamate endopeptidase CwlK
MKLSERCVTRLLGLHPDLVKVVNRAAELTTVDFIVTEGKRTVARQRELFKAKATQTMDSRHLTGHAVDVAAKVAGQVRWDWPLYYQIAEAFKEAAEEYQVALEWGGDWKTFKDGPHYQLSWKRYPL